MIICNNCKSENQEGKRYCGDCGESLIIPDSDQFELIDKRIEKAFENKFKDQKLIEVETTQAIASRFAKWSKLLGFFIGIPIILFTILLATFGIKTYHDFASLVRNVEDKIKPKLEEAKNISEETVQKAKEASKQVNILQKETSIASDKLSEIKVVEQKLIAQANALKKQFEEVSRINQELGDLSIRVSRVEKEVAAHIKNAAIRRSNTLISTCAEDEIPAAHSTGFSLTYFLQKALKNGDADSDSDGFIIGEELFQYLRNNIHAKSVQYGIKNTPTFITLPGHEQGSFLFRSKNIKDSNSSDSLKPLEFYDDSYALIIGIDNYESQLWRPLNHNREISNQLADTLKSIGFKVIALYDEKATHKRILEEFENFLKITKKRDRIIIIFSGHSMTRNLNKRAVSYIIPYDAKNSFIEYISLDTIIDYSNKYSAKHKLHIFDTCLDLPYSR